MATIYDRLIQPQQSAVDAYLEAKQRKEDFDLKKKYYDIQEQNARTAEANRQLALKKFKEDQRQFDAKMLFDIVKEKSKLSEITKSLLNSANPSVKARGFEMLQAEGKGNYEELIDSLDNLEAKDIKDKSRKQVITDIIQIPAQFDELYQKSLNSLNLTKEEKFDVDLRREAFLSKEKEKLELKKAEYRDSQMAVEKLDPTLAEFTNSKYYNNRQANIDKLLEVPAFQRIVKTISLDEAKKIFDQKVSEGMSKEEAAEFIKKNYKKQ